MKAEVYSMRLSNRETFGPSVSDELTEVIGDCTDVRYLVYVDVMDRSATPMLLVIKHVPDTSVRWAHDDMGTPID